MHKEFEGSNASQLLHDIHGRPGSGAAKLSGGVYTRRSTCAVVTFDTRSTEGNFSWAS